ncbi:helix-turn-helix domain-containing protein [Nitrincola sp. MINF-07-Sa-05]|uniref:helix-turn-helix domain-containing protein n=1 Tax=Nitrincola salilacus TaxID=3400273 RepID=UPI003917E83F
MLSVSGTMDVRSYQADACEHQHSYHQLVMPLRGCLDMEIDRRAGRVDARHGAVVLAGSSHSFSAAQDNGFIVADLAEGDVNTLQDLGGFVTLKPALSDYLSFLSRALLSGVSEANKQLMLQLLLQLLCEQPDGRVQLDRRLQMAVDFMQQNLGRPLRIQQVAGMARLSSRQLQNLFQQQLGLSPQHYLLQLRMQQALTLLQETDLSVQQVADACGYQNLSAFSARFSAYHGCSARRFRQP